MKLKPATGPLESDSTVGTSARYWKTVAQHLGVRLFETRKALKELVEISGEAHIELKNSHSVRQMGKFVKARESAQKILEKT